jgi:diguanylate cyclase (GGDEF)-like protein
LVDRTVLPEFQRLIAAAVARRGYAYAEGGDEVVILLPNTSISIAAAFAEQLRRAIERHCFPVDNGSVSLTLSIGAASGTSVLSQLPDWANLAKQQAKQLGRNRTVTTTDGVVFREVPAEPALIKE